MKSQVLEAKYSLWIGIIVSVLLSVAVYYAWIRKAEHQIFADRFEHRGLSRMEAEKRGILGLPIGTSSYSIKRCAFRDSWIVFSKYKIKDAKLRKEQVRRFLKNPGLKLRFDSYPKDWPQDFDRDDCRPDWWESCSRGEWAEIGDKPATAKSKDGFYLCETGEELRWFVFHFRDIE